MLDDPAGALPAEVIGGDISGALRGPSHHFSRAIDQACDNSKDIQRKIMMRTKWWDM